MHNVCPLLQTIIGDFFTSHEAKWEQMRGTPGKTEAMDGGIDFRPTSFLLSQKLKGKLTGGKVCSFVWFEEQFSLSLLILIWKKSKENRNVAAELMVSHCEWCCGESTVASPGSCCWGCRFNKHCRYYQGFMVKDWVLAGPTGRPGCPSTMSNREKQSQRSVLCCHTGKNGRGV